VRQKTNEIKDGQNLKRKDTLERKITSERKKKEIVNTKQSRSELKDIVDSIWL
jgi:hypothetical protein